jgi:RNA polymerase sigma-70 factor, ECF subfamily
MSERLPDNTIRMGERSAGFERIFRVHHGAVCRYAVRRVGAETAPDAVCETFLAVWRRFDTLAGEPLPWLLGIARHVCSNQLRSTRRRTALYERVAHEPHQAGNEEPGDTALLAALARLTSIEREALMLVAWDGLNNHQAAAVSGCTPTTFGVRAYRARRRLKRLIGTRPGVLRPERAVMRREQ